MLVLKLACPLQAALAAQRDCCLGASAVCWLDCAASAAALGHMKQRAGTGRRIKWSPADCQAAHLPAPCCCRRPAWKLAWKLRLRPLQTLAWSLAWALWQMLGASPAWMLAAMPLHKVALPQHAHVSLRPSLTQTGCSRSGSLATCPS